MYTAVIVTGSKTVKVGIHFVSGTNEEFAGFRPSLVNDAAISRLIEINLSLKKGVKNVSRELAQRIKPLTDRCA